MEGDCNVYAHSSLWMRPTGEWSINAKMVKSSHNSQDLIFLHFCLEIVWRVRSILVEMLNNRIDTYRL